MNFDEVADELYGLPPERFTATRTDRERQARSTGDRDLAARIRALPKPNAVAWLANQLARRHAEELGPLLELGAQLREATTSLQGEQLRALTRQRHQVVHALVQQGRALAADAGHRVSDETARGLEDTLTAALADPEAAQRLAAGRLTEGLHPAGFTAPDAGSPPAPAARPAQKPAADRKRERAEQDYEAARRAAAAAHDRQAEAERMVQKRSAEVEEAAAESARLRRELERAEQAQRRAEVAQQRAQEAVSRAAEELRRAQERERETERRLATLPAASG